ncbi:MAG: hypothetical protein V2A78_06010 [bacterium]
MIPAKWEWERTKVICVFATFGVISEKIDITRKIIKETNSELDLPFEVLNGNTEKQNDLQYIEALLAESIIKINNIDFGKLTINLRSLREKGLLLYAIIILVDSQKYVFHNPPDVKKEPAIYGQATAEGLIVIRDQYISEATIHEYGHMAGQEHCGKQCVMGYICKYPKFCPDCTEYIKNNLEY